MCARLMGGDQEGGSRTAGGWTGPTNIMQDGTVDLQHGTAVDGNSPPCIKQHYPK
jgi:hypothetical protein